MSSTALTVRKTPLDSWIVGKLNISPDQLSRETISQYQAEKLQQTLEWVCRSGGFYSQHLAGVAPRALSSLGEIRHLPFTRPTDLAANPGGFLCVSQDEIERVVTFASSGTSGDPKRLFFTAADLELALDFFEHGVSTVAAPGEAMLIALPGEREGSVGYQLAKGIARAGILPIPNGIVQDPMLTLKKMEELKAASIIGLPVQILSLAYHAVAAGSSAFQSLRSVVLCSDHVPDSLMNAIRRRSGAEIFQHYGMTEMGLGGGIDCEAHEGYHLRETDFYFEIVDVNTGEPLPEGEEGEIVFTTLTRTGMPLIRYRTGDISRFVGGTCSCGSILRRLEKIKRRIDSEVPLSASGTITISMLDEVLFGVPGVLDFRASLASGNRLRLTLLVNVMSDEDELVLPQIIDALDRIAVIREARRRKELELRIDFTHQPLPLTAEKRRIEVFENR